MSIFRLFQLSVLIAYNVFFFVLEYDKTHFPHLYCVIKKKLEKWQILDKNHELTPLEKYQFFEFLNFLFL